MTSTCSRQLRRTWSAFYASSLHAPGMTESIDFQHSEWKKCPTQFVGQYKGKEKKPTIVLEGVAEGNDVYGSFFTVHRDL